MVQYIMTDNVKHSIMLLHRAVRFYTDIRTSEVSAILLQPMSQYAIRLARVSPYRQFTVHRRCYHIATTLNSCQLSVPFLASIDVRPSFRPPLLPPTQRAHWSVTPSYQSLHFPRRTEHSLIFTLSAPHPTGRRLTRATERHKRPPALLGVVGGPLRLPRSPLAHASLTANPGSVEPADPRGQLSPRPRRQATPSLNCYYSKRLQLMLAHVPAIYVRVTPCHAHLPCYY